MNDVAHLRFDLRRLMFVVFVIAVLLWFFLPVASINSATCNRIKPGMTLEEATNIIGAPQGSYDGVWGYSSSYPEVTKGGPETSWVGWQGELVLELERPERVQSATLYSIEIHNWSLSEFLWERFTRVKYWKLTLPARVLLFMAQAALGIFALGFALVPDRAKNRIALHGAIGLVLGVVLAVAIFSEGFFNDLVVTFFALSGPIFGALAGIAVGSVLDFCARRSVSETANDNVSQAAIVP